MLTNWDKQTPTLLLSAVFLIAIPTIGAAPPQPDYTNALRVSLTGTCRNLPKEDLIVILNGNEQVPAYLTPIGTSRREWEGEWHDPDHPSKQFLAKGSVASARLRGRRTDCRKSDSRKRNDRIEAVFSLDCDHNPAADITIQGSPDPWRYRRFLQKTRDETADSDCDESAGPNSGLREIWDVRLPKEVIKIGFKGPDKNQFWITLNNLPVGKKPGKGASVTLDHDRITDEIVRSMSQEQFAPNAYETVRKHPRITPDTKFTIKVN